MAQISGTPESLILNPQEGHQDGSEEEIISAKSIRRQHTDEFKKKEAVQLLLDGYTAPQVVDRLGISNVNVLYR